MTENCCDCTKEHNEIEGEYECSICHKSFCETHFVEHIPEEHWIEYVQRFEASFNAKGVKKIE